MKRIAFISIYTLCATLFSCFEISGDYDVALVFLYAMVLSILAAIALSMFSLRCHRYFFANLKWSNRYE